MPHAARAALSFAAALLSEPPRSKACRHTSCAATCGIAPRRGVPGRTALGSAGQSTQIPRPSAPFLSLGTTLRGGTSKARKSPPRRKSKRGRKFSRAGDRTRYRRRPAWEASDPDADQRPPAETWELDTLPRSPAPAGATAGSKAAITGDFVLTADEVQPVLETLRGAGIAVTALHSHMLGEDPRLFFMHFWANDDALKLAGGLHAALSRMKVKAAAS